MKRVARLLRRIANRIDPPMAPAVWTTANTTATPSKVTVTYLP